MYSMINTGIISLVTTLAVLKLYLKLTWGICRSKSTMEGKTVIVTGANSGIGLETARDLASRKARVILACRSMDRGMKALEDIVQSTGNSNVIVKILDLSSLTSVRNFSADINTSEPRLDVLIHNAGVSISPGKHLTEDNLELQFATNHFGPFLLTHLLIDLLKRSAPSRIVIVSSLTHMYARLDLDNLNFEKYQRDPFWVYASTKLSNLLFTLELSERLSGTGVTVNALHPGGVRTNIFQDSRWFLKYLTIPILYPFFKDAKTGAQTSIYLAVSSEVANISGKYFVDCKPAWTTPKARNRELAKELWKKSEIFTEIKTTID